MKRFLALLLAVVMMFTLCACGKTAPKDDTADKGGNTTAATTTTTTTETEDTTTTTTEAEGTTTTEAEGTTTDGTEAPTTGTEADKPTTGATTTKKPTTEATKTPTTSSTRKPPITGFIPTLPTNATKPTRPTEPDDGRPTIKILSIGHSFSKDAMVTYMWDLFEAAGYNTTIAYLFYPGCSLERQYHFVKDNINGYEEYGYNSDGTWVVKNGACVTDALWDDDWDIVTFQPSPDYGTGISYDCNLGCNRTLSSDYMHFGTLVNTVKDYLTSSENPYGPNRDVKFYYHLTWAFATDCKLWSFQYSDYDQMKMYNNFISATKQHVVNNNKIEGVIPCITSIQNARTTWMGDTFNVPGEYNPNKDGYHLNDKGDLVAAMTWVAYFTGKSPKDFKIKTPYSDAEYTAFTEAVDNAIKKWDSVTESKYKTQP